MPSYPPPNTVTICEINRHLVTADEYSDEIATEAYAKILGVVFSPVQFQADDSVIENRNSSDAQLGRNGEKGLPALLASFKRIFHPNDVHLLPKVNLQGVSWHQHKHILAFISGSNQVTIRDYGDSEGKDASILHGDFQQEVQLVEWRPNSGRTLSVACKGGICIWAASYPGNPASVRSGAASFVGTISKGSGMRWTLVDFLKSHDGIGTPIRRGLGGISMLKWSPSGDYFFSAKFDGTFYLWETGTWTSQPWSSTSGFVTGATWDPDSRMILLAFSESSTLGSVHFASKPPSLVAHLLPVELPEIVNLTGSQSIEKIAWDGSGERLAVSFKEGDESYKGLIAIYDVRRTPLIAATLFGFIRGPGENPKPVSFSFHDKLKQGPLLSVCWSTGFCCTYPLLFRSHVIP